MSKYAAKIQIGWIDEWFEGDSPIDIIKKAEEVQDFNCLLDMGRSMEGKKGQKELDKLCAFLDKYHNGILTMDDIKNLSINLSVGRINCDSIEIRD